MSTLYDYLCKLRNTDEDEITVWDIDYDIETYFYVSATDEETEEWDKSMMMIAKKLTVTEELERGVVVNLSEVIEKNMNNFGKLFIDNDIDLIMEDVENIFSGCVSDKWLREFAEALA